MELRRSPETGDFVRTIALAPGTYQVSLALQQTVLSTLRCSACVQLWCDYPVVAWWGLETQV